MPQRRQKQRSIFPLVLVAIGVFLIAGAIIWAANAPPLEGPVPEPTDVSIIPLPNVPRVSLQDGRAAYETDAAVFVDTRGEPFYSEGHIPGAISIPEQEVPSLIGELDQEDWIITYCT